MSRMIQWDREGLKLLQAGIAEARRMGKDRFALELPSERKPVELLVSYAVYLVEYLEGEFARHPDQPRQPYNEGEEGQ